QQQQAALLQQVQRRELLALDADRTRVADHAIDLEAAVQVQQEGDDVAGRREEVRRELLLQRDPDDPHAPTSAVGTGATAAVEPVTCAKYCSRVGRDSVSSRSARPAGASRAKAASRGSTPCSTAAVKVAKPSPASSADAVPQPG